MTRRIAFLRAVNLGRRTVKMARLVEIFEGLGYEGVWTYINSGNVVFDAPGSRADLEQTIASAIEADHGFECTTFVRSASELHKIVAEKPFSVAKTDMYYVTLLKSAPTAATARKFESLSNDFDTVVVRGHDVHWRMHGRSVDTTLKKKEWRVLGEHSTSRNITMLRKLSAKLDG